MAPLKRVCLLLPLLSLFWLSFPPSPSLKAQKKSRSAVLSEVDDATLRNVETRPGEWLAHGRNQAETRYSPLKQIEVESVKQLGLAWSFDTQTTRGLEATPLVVNGVMYTTGSWSIVYALDAKTGQPIWQYDPQVPQHFGTRACCDVVNRGVAFYQNKVYVGTLDGRLVALNAATGKPVWSVVTVNQEQAYTITGAPRVVKGKVIIGNGGGEYGVRGYVSAYDAATGKLVWRFYTVPGDPAKPFENAALKKAAATWNGEWWKLGGGGTAWDSFAYDPTLDLLYVGTGNGSPWNQAVRSPGGGDNLYLSSIVALRPSTGQYVWHYQTTPGDCWDYTATQHMILADLTLNGRVRKVLMQAPKNGFFYVLDRATGELISAEKFVTVTWATEIDKKTGRPVENPAARYTVTNQPSLQQPGPLGAHNWMPMSFNPQTGLVYIPAQETNFLYLQDRNFQPRLNGWTLGVDFSLFTEVPPQIPTGHLLAWDPVAQKERWRVQYPIMWNSGTLTTAGNLVFQGTADGRFVAYSADRGAKLWEVIVGTGIIATPMTYELDGVQYVTVLAGWGGSFALTGGNATGATMTGRVLTFALNSKQPLPLPVAQKMRPPAPIEFQASAETLASGAGLFAQNCAVCHGIGATGGGGLLPDLRQSAPAVFNKFQQIVHDGSLLSVGMPAFKGWLKPAEVEAIRAYLLSKRAAITQK
jgi:quinohemoprotein ethanol dehydrogenase